MKKIFAVVLALSILFCFTACNNTSTDYLDETVSIDVEALKADWQQGKITFANGNSVILPCEVTEFTEKSTLVYYDNEQYENLVIKPDEVFGLSCADNNTMIDIKVTPVKADYVALQYTKVISVTIKDIKEGNRDIKFANSLTTGALRADVEKALGIPEGATTEDSTYTYTNDRVILTVTFNEKNVVNEITYSVA